MSHVSGKDVIMADTLSRAPVWNSNTDDTEFQQEVEAFVNQVIDQLPATEQWIKQIREHQQLDETCCQIIKHRHNG